MVFRYTLTFCTLLFFLFPSAFAAPLLLTPQPSMHQFPFFKTETPVWSYNNQIPGPVLRGKEGTTLEVKVQNKLQEATTVHWHGLRIDNAMDGVPGVTQEPIKPGETFTYRLDLKEAGTFWYHPHLNTSEQLERGLKGALIVDEKNPLPWSRDIVWLIDDWFLQKDGTIFPHFNTHHDLMHDGRWGNAITINGKFKPTLEVSPGERIRLRLINGANARIFSHTLAGLSPKVIAVDGRPVSKPFPYENFPISPGNRVDLDITIPSDSAGRTYFLKDRATRNEFELGKISVRKGAAIPTPSFEVPLLSDFIPADKFANLEVNKTWDLNLIRGGKYGIGWAMNQKLWPDADKAKFKIGQPVKITFKNSSNNLHPMHIHGVFFRVLSINGKSAPEPFTRDTVLVGPKETVTIGFVPEDKGIWMSHCHIVEHAESGMMTTIEIK